ncbi:MAG: lysophospholipid acyltransferase family protein [Verrucomicrobiota bacterium]
MNKSSARPQRFQNQAFYIFVCALCHYLFRCYHSLRVEGQENIPHKGGIILASNHTSFYDPPALAAGCHRILHFLARKTLFDHPLFRWLITNLNAIPVDQENPDMTGLRTIISKLKLGHIVVLFPEGSRTFDGELLPAQPGVGLVVEKAKVPVLPARFFGMHTAWPRGGSPRFFTPITLVFGKPFIPSSDKTDKRERYQEMSDQIMAAIAEIQPPKT